MCIRDSPDSENQAAFSEPDKTDRKRFPNVATHEDRKLAVIGHLRKWANNVRSGLLGSFKTVGDKDTGDGLDKEAKTTQMANVRANEPKFIHATNHRKMDYRDLAVAVNKAVSDPNDDRSENAVAHEFCNASTAAKKKEAEAILQAIRIYERRKRKPT